MKADRKKVEWFVQRFLAVPICALLFWSWVLIGKAFDATNIAWSKLKIWWMNRKTKRELIQS